MIEKDEFANYISQYSNDEIHEAFDILVTLNLIPKEKREEYEKLILERVRLSEPLTEERRTKLEEEYLYRFKKKYDKNN